MPENSDIEIERIKTLVSERGLKNFNLAYFDHNGRVRSKYYSSEALAKALDEGLAMHLAVFSDAPDGTPMENSRFLDPANQFRDGTIRLAAESCRDFPLDGDVHNLLLIGEMIDAHRVYCPRALLSEELSRYSATGLKVYGAFEFEWYLLEEDSDSIKTRLPSTVKAYRGFREFYSFIEQQSDNPLFRELIDTCSTMGMPLEAAHTEHTQLMEGALSPAFDTAIADNAGLFKTVVKTLVRKHGLMASFMARRSMDAQGCGAHINLSLKDMEDRPVFYDAEAPETVPDTLRWFLGGLQRYTPELFLLQAPNLNSYRRYQPGLFTPINNTWGIDNKTTAFRVVTGQLGITRIENRLPGADVHPHLALLGMLAAGRKGMEQKLEPAAPIMGDGWSVLTDDDRVFPLDFPSAIARFEGSGLAREVLGDAFVDCYVSGRRWQLEQLAASITDWELRTFIEGA